MKAVRAVAAVVSTVSTPWLPAWAVATALHPRWRVGARARWALEVPPATPGCVWIHAASVGEVGAAEALAAALEGPVLLTADTDTGLARAEQAARRLGARVVAGPRPVDHPWTLAPLWAQARPRAVVFVEGTWWPVLAATAARSGVPVLRVGVRVGPRTRRLGRLYGPLYRSTLLVARDDEAARWLEAHGVAGVPVGGDLKGDLAPSASPLTIERPFVVGASTRPGDEAALLAAAPPGLVVVLAPRHPARFDEVAASLVGRRWCRRSDLADGAVPGDVDVVLLDSVGELPAVLQGARAALIGGTFDPAIGGHSPAEAVAAGVPVVSGPEVAANRAAFPASGWEQVARPEELPAALARALVQELAPRRSGAATRTAAWLAPWLQGPPAPPSSPRPWARGPGVILGVAASARGVSWSRRAERVGVPVISVGSTDARGPGRTSTTRWMARELAARGHRVGVAVRGYRRAHPGREVRVSTTTNSAADLGDEGALHALDGHLVAACPDRVAAARALVAAGATVVVLDDGLQHRRLHRDLDLAVIDARDPSARGLLPAGERRELRAVPRRVHGVIAHHGTVVVPGKVVAVAVRSLGPWRQGDAVVAPPSTPVLAFAGIARPADWLAGLDVPIGEVLVLADHAPIGAALAARLLADGRPLVCTAKDRVRLPESLREVVWWRDVELEVTGAPESWFTL